MTRIDVIDAAFAAAASDPAHFPPPTGVEIAFAGRSNVGKSSLMNALLGRRNLVRTSSTPGCTRQISFFEARCADNAVVTLVDLPGFGYAKRSRSERASWAQLIEHYLLERPSLAVVAILLDARRGLETEEQDLIRMLEQPAPIARHPLQLQLVATKLDRIKSSERRAKLQRLQSAHTSILGSSLRDPASIEQLWQRLRQLAGIRPST